MRYAIVSEVALRPALSALPLPGLCVSAFKIPLFRYTPGGLRGRPSPKLRRPLRELCSLSVCKCAYVFVSAPILLFLLFPCAWRKPARMNKNRSVKSVAAAFLSLLVFGIADARGGDADHPLMNGKLRVTTLSPEEIRYTGKPYSKALGAYVFNARAYDATTSRWTTPDPSGFPDGANGRVYAPVPTGDFDFGGCYAVKNSSGVGNSWIQMSNVASDSLNSIAGKEVYHGDQGDPNRRPDPLDGQCATGAQFLCGTIAGHLHDSPLTGTWAPGLLVQGHKIQAGTMIAAGWDSNGVYESNLSGNHTAIYLSQNSSGVTVFDQYAGTKLGKSTWAWNKFGIGIASWAVVTTTIQDDPNRSVSFLE